ncbi:hypothetical protein [Pontibacter kalidii]|uniref:hypothetical protein n=1 Tax=Pontibacter kalidii TaxID=2592049 RepID=UPI00225B3824|nr:hypothetical protein [Pontibacter kalidii]
MRKNLFYSAALAAVVLASCSSEKAPETQATTAAEAPANHEAHMASMQPQQQASPADLMTEEGLPKDLVCMVNNAFMGKEQFPVAFEDKMYYGCCEMCVNTIKNQREVRYAKDPVTGQEVDKSQAFIALKPGGANGEVLYFASEESFRKYAQ